MRILDESQVTQLLVAARDTRHAALLHVALTTGMRMGELLGLTWDDVDWQGAIRVERQLQRDGSLASPKTRHGRRVVAVGERTLESLRQQRNRLDMERKFAGKRWKENNLIFPSSVGTPQSQRNVLRDFKKVLAGAGLPDFRFHDLRHTAAALMLNHGVPVIIVSRRLGHSRPSITLDLYGHLIPGLQADAAEKMDELVTPVEIEYNTHNSV
jgi:integrase